MIEMNEWNGDDVNVIKYIIVNIIPIEVKKKETKVWIIY